MLPLQAHARLMKLLPKLSAVTDAYRLKVLSEIDRVLAAEGQTWADIAEALSEPQGGSLPVAELLAIIERIEQQYRSSASWQTPLTDNACSFLADLREKAAVQIGEVHLTFRQGQWLYALQEQAERERKRMCELAEPKQPVLITAARLEKLKLDSASLTESDLSFLNDLYERATAMKKRSVSVAYEEWSRLSHLEIWGPRTDH
jgi:hypothetical protein